MEEFAADAASGRCRGRRHARGADFLAQIGHFVDEVTFIARKACRRIGQLGVSIPVCRIGVS